VVASRAGRFARFLSWSFAAHAVLFAGLLAALDAPAREELAPPVCDIGLRIRIVPLPWRVLDEPTANELASADVLRAADDAGVAHPWAGRYVRAAGPRTTQPLMLAPAAFAFCTPAAGGETAIVRGRPVAALGRLRLIVEDSGAAGGLAPGELSVVAWGDRRYLLAAGGEGHFCKLVELGIEPRRSAFGLTWLRVGDERMLVGTRSRLPTGLCR